MEVLGFGALAVAAALAIVVTSRRRRARVKAWREAASDAELTAVSVLGDLVGGSLQGRSGHLSVRFEAYRSGEEDSGTRITIRRVDDANGLSIRSEGIGTGLAKRLDLAREVEIGDEFFDRRFFVEGTAPLAFALLDAKTRRRLTSLLGGGLWVEDRERVSVRATLVRGVLTLEVPNNYGAVNPRLATALRGGLDLLRTLAPPSDIPARIAENLRGEPEPGVRLAALATLQREYPEHGATRQALIAAVHDRSDEVRLRAGLALGEQGREILLALAGSPKAGDSCSARAVTALGDGLPREEVEATLRRALESNRPATAVACLHGLVRFGSAAAEAALLEALRHPDAAVALAAVRALGHVGTVAAVGPLHELEDRDSSARAAARQAVAEIQSRLTGASPGQLSLADGNAGALSLADGDTGALSLADGEASHASMLHTNEAEPEATSGPNPPLPATKSAERQ